MKNIEPKFYGIVNELGELKVNDVVRYKQHLLNLKGEVEIIVKKKSNRKRNRSSEQNRYYNGVILPMVARFMSGYDTPIEREAAHNALKMLFLKDENRKIPTTRSTATLTTIEFETYMTNIRMYMSSEYSLYLPKPNEVVIP